MSFYAQIYIFLKLYNNVHTVNHNNFTFFLPVMLYNAVTLMSWTSTYIIPSQDFLKKDNTL